jgi:cold shock CspA family protein
LEGGVPKQRGTVKFFDIDRGCGRIAVEGDGDVLVHISTLPLGFVPQAGDRVVFDVVLTYRGRWATAIERDSSS